MVRYSILQTIRFASCRNKDVQHMFVFRSFPIVKQIFRNFDLDIFSCCLHLLMPHKSWLYAKVVGYSDFSFVCNCHCHALRQIKMQSKN